MFVCSLLVLVLAFAAIQTGFINELRRTSDRREGVQTHSPLTAKKETSAKVKESHQFVCYICWANHNERRIAAAHTAEVIT